MNKSKLRVDKIIFDDLLEENKPASKQVIYQSVGENLLSKGATRDHTRARKYFCYCSPEDLHKPTLFNSTNFMLRPLVT